MSVWRIKFVCTNCDTVHEVVGPFDELLKLADELKKDGVTGFNMVDDVTQTMAEMDAQTEHVPFFFQEYRG